MTEEEVIKKVGQLARKYYQDDQYSCAEAILKAFAEVFAPEKFDTELIASLATPFNGGFSELQHTCGVLTAGMMAIGLVAGRSKPGDEDAKEEAYTLTQIYYQRYMEAMGTDSCKELLIRWKDQGEGKCHCKDHTVKMSELLAKTILQLEFHDLELDEVA
ncbi:MAG: C_GCAxxG_C_C family protein [Magnetococcales bacterium]|nr:C_GCAxxG_C_C family protein [Magnetococcales bacterium]